ncbi:MAG: hypothetical protein WA667_01065 [Candidatus Nitrosopolaris sp.]
MRARKQISPAQLIDVRIIEMIRMKGQIEGIMASMPRNHVQRGICTWILGIVNEMLAISNAIRVDYISTTTRLNYIEKAMRAILASDWDTPPQELFERARLLGSSYKELSRRRKGET